MARAAVARGGVGVQRCPTRLFVLMLLFGLYRLVPIVPAGVPRSENGEKAAVAGGIVLLTGVKKPAASWV